MDSSHVKFDRPLPLFLLPVRLISLLRIGASVGYVQTILSDVARASSQLVPHLVSHVCHHSRSDLFLCGHKSIVTCASQLHRRPGVVKNEQGSSHLTRWMRRVRKLVEPSRLRVGT
jgi:hypothetical protein